MTKHIYRILSLLVITVLLASCAGFSPTTTQEKTPIRIGWSLYPGWYPLVIAQEQGIFKKYNLEVELVLYEAYKDTAPQLASGLVDGATLVLGDVLLEDVGNSSSIVLVTDNSDGADQLIASPEVMQSQDLKGKRIGFSAGTFGELLVRDMLKKYNVAISDVELVEVPPEAVAGAIPVTIDIGHTFEPFASQARAKGNGVIYTSADSPGIIVDTVAFTDKFIEERPEDVRNFINAWFEAVDFWQKNPQQGNEIIAAAIGQDVKDINFEGIKFFDRNANLATFQPGSDTTSVIYTAQLELDFLASTGVISNRLDIAKILNPSFLKVEE
jgi:NitT/TauT family transport system substrate-binding protein